MRGDNCPDENMPDKRGGSPPHAWGQYANVSFRFLALRFTPTCVGTIGFTSFKDSLFSVHPHMRGDNTEKLSKFMEFGPKEDLRSSLFFVRSFPMS